MTNLDTLKAIAEGSRAFDTQRDRKALAELIAVGEAAKFWRIAHEENVRLLHQGMIPPTETKQAVCDAAQVLKAKLDALNESEGQS